MKTKTIALPIGETYVCLNPDRSWNGKPTSDHKHVMDWLMRGGLVGLMVGRKYDRMGLDVDEGGEDTLRHRGWGLPSGLGCTSPTSGNFHRVYRMPSGTFPISSGNDVFGMGLSLKASDNQYIIVAGDNYDVYGQDIPYPPHWMEEIIIKKSTRIISKPDTEKEYTKAEENERAEWLMGIIDRGRADDYETWKDVGMALSTMKDERFAFKLFHDFSRRGENYKGEYDCQKKWDTFQREKGDNLLTLGSLYYWAVEEDNPQLLLHAPIGKSEAKILDREIEKATEEIKEDGLPDLDDDLTDLGNAKRLIALHGHEMRWCEDERVWYVWNGKKWEADKDSKVLSFCEDVSRLLFKEASESTDKEEGRHLGKHAIASQSANAFKNMLFLAHTHSIHLEDFDKDNELLNLENGIVNLRTGELLPHDSKYLMRKMANMSYDAEATCPKWVEFLTYAQDNDMETVEWIQKALGLSASGRTDKALPFMFGLPNCGKSTLSETMMLLLGDYASKTNLSAFAKSLDDGGDKPNSQVAGLRGMRFVIANETGRDMKLLVSVLKDVTGQDTLTARKQHGAKETFQQTHTMWIYGNHQPDLSADIDDDAFFFRLREVPFNVPITEMRPMDDVKAEYLAEASGILNWLVDGFQMWLKDGLKNTKKIDDATNRFRKSQDYLLAFIEEEYEIDEQGKVRKADFVEEFNEHLRKIGQRAVTPNLVGRRMPSLGFEIGGQGKSFFIGLRKRGVMGHKTTPTPTNQKVEDEL